MARTRVGRRVGNRSYWFMNSDHGRLRQQRREVGGYVEEEDKEETEDEPVASSYKKRTRFEENADGEEGGRGEAHGKGKRNDATHMAHFRDWLEREGLGDYAALFKIHNVNDEILPLLSFEDLKEIRITSVGTRRKIYRYICEFPHIDS